MATAVVAPKEDDEMAWLIEGRDEAGEWSWRSVADKRELAVCATEQEAEKVVENLISTTGWERERLRVRES